jgi:predicted alpha-1,6-mannanase (GH76 family)
VHLRRLTATVAAVCCITLFTAAPAHAETPRERADVAVTKLLTYYNSGTGAWTTPTGEAWQPALGIDSVINSYERTRAQSYRDVLNKSFERYRGRRAFYDDNGWYLNAWIRAYDVTGESKFLDEAKALFTANTAGWDSTCGGGLWWNSNRDYKNAITNELFLLAAAQLHRRAPNGTGAGSYYDWAFREWNWFRNSGMINGNRMVNDGLNGSCVNNGGITWTYNQGVILAGLVELWRITADRGYLYQAEQIAEATINNQVHAGGILREPCEISGNCDGDQKIFKGIFAVGLARLYFADPGNKPAYGAFLRRNADSVWNSARDGGNGLALRWVGPPGSADQATQASAGLLLDQAVYA